MGKRDQDHASSNHSATAKIPVTTSKSPSMFRQLGIRGWGLIVAFATLVTIFCGFLIIRSDVTITPHVRLDPADPFSMLYTVTNEGSFVIKDVGFSCHMNHVEVHNYMFAVHDLPGSTDPKGEPEVAARKSQDVACLFGAAGWPIKTSPNGPPPEYHSADITLIVSYRPHFWWRRIQSERFIGRTNGHGKIVEWSHQAG